ncbi:hypothetical protein J7T55_005540 [Diaporthe amygdali]|uniref:uncharacterized protein n=1 Tax=Phomopsis amygdali TaxID=1214568 RepID=UPI0022FE4561|nr:uncharacterized protein J7T55_005540 [Diaporthe amygdali]KAJ0108992.1 hypothetical protein J7T55_005540 [Diaporthe amygdali]
MASKGLQDPGAVLAIDIGSTETRLVFAWQTDDGIQIGPIENDSDKPNHLNTMAHFSSKFFPFDNDPQKYIANASRSKREDSSVKFVPYVLLGTTEEMEGQYPVLSRLWSERNKTGFDEALFRSRLEEAFKQFLRFVLTRAKQVFRVSGPDDLQIRVKTIAMTVPSQWDLDFQDLYERLVKEVFEEIFEDVSQADARNVNVIFHTEATALAQYIFNQCSSNKVLSIHRDMPNIGTIMDKTNAQCLVDCGGHNANSALTTFHRNNSGLGMGVMYEIGHPKGAGGGMEMWIHHLLIQLDDQYCRKFPWLGEMPLELKQAFKREINKNIADILTEDCHWVFQTHPQTGDVIPLEITMEMSDKAFQAGFKYVKIMILEQLQRLASISKGWRGRDYVVTIIVSGGSSLHPEFVKWIETLCTELSLPAPLFAHAMQLLYGSSRIAMGAAYATLTQQSVASFAEKCAFGLQKGRVRRRGGADEYLRLRESADTIWCKERGTIQTTVDSEGDDAEFRVVCLPYLESFAPTLQTDKNLAQGASYDFMNIGTLPGEYKTRIEFIFNIEARQVILKVALIRANVGNRAIDRFARRNATLRERVLQVGPFDVRVQPGTLCLFIAQPVEVVDQHIDSILGACRRVSAVESRAESDVSYGGKIPGSTRQPKTITAAPANVVSKSAKSKTANSKTAKSKTAANKNNESTARATAPTNETPSASRIAALETSTPHRPVRTQTAPVLRLRASSNQVSSSSQAAPQRALEAPDVERTTTSNAGLHYVMRDNRDGNVVSGREASSSRQMALGSEGSGVSGSATASRKRPAPSEADDSHPAKRNPANRRLFTTSSEAARNQGSDISGRQRPAASEARVDHTARPERANSGISSGTPLSSNRASSIMESSGYQGSAYADNQRSSTSETRVGHTAKRDPNHNVSFSGPRPTGTATPRPPYHGTAASRASPDGTAIRPLPTGSRGPAPRSHPSRNTDTAGSKKSVQKFPGYRAANRGPPRSD